MDVGCVSLDSFSASSDGVQCKKRHLTPRRQPWVTKCLHIFEKASECGPPSVCVVCVCVCVCVCVKIKVVEYNSDQTKLH